MPCINPTGDGSPVALNLPVEHVAVLQDNLSDWLDGLRSDLATSERLQDPERRQKEAEAYERLLLALTTRQLFLPDEEAQAFLRSAAKGYDEANDYAEVVANHDAMHGLLAVLERGEA